MFEQYWKTYQSSRLLRRRATSLLLHYLPKKEYIEQVCIITAMAVKKGEVQFIN